MGSQTIQAYFDRPEQAEEAETKLLALRAKHTAVERIGDNPAAGTYGFRLDNSFIPPSAMSAMPLAFGGGDFTSHGAGLIIGAGIANNAVPGDGGAGGERSDLRLTAEIDDGVLEQALTIIRHAGGRV